MASRGFAGQRSLATLLPGLVEDLDVFQLHADAGPELHGICGVVFAASLYGAIGMSPNKKNTKISGKCSKTFN